VSTRRISTRGLSNRCGPAWGGSPGRTRAPPPYEETAAGADSVGAPEADAPVALESEEKLLGLETAREPGQVAVGSDHAVAGRHDRDRVLAAGGADGSGSHRTSDLLGDLGVGPR